jgi:hypothetical protein
MHRTSVDTSVDLMRALDHRRHLVALQQCGSAQLRCVTFTVCPGWWRTLLLLFLRGPSVVRLRITCKASRFTADGTHAATPFLVQSAVCTRLCRWVGGRLWCVGGGLAVRCCSCGVWRTPPWHRWAWPRCVRISCAS